jgi:hypothetical protein
MAGTRINGRDPVLMIDGIDRSDEASAVTPVFGTRTTFAEQRGTKPKRLDMTITQDLAAGSLYRLAIGGDNTPVVGLYKPLGNVAATVDQPHFSFTATPSGPSSDNFMGGEAAEDPSEPATVDVQWLLEDWTEVTA